jgi:mRNA-degrading endonuclease RelE of RelBE toxin-antitoxin system
MLEDNPSAGNPLKSSSERLRSLRIGKYKVIYKTNEKIFTLAWVRGKISIVIVCVTPDRMSDILRILNLEITRGR